LHIVPCVKFFSCAGQIDLLALARTARGFHGLCMSACGWHYVQQMSTSLWKAKCVAAGITPPSGFCDVDALMALHAIGLSTHGGQWILSNEEELDSLIAVGGLSLQDTMPSVQTARRLSFRASALDIDSLRDQFSGWLGGLPSNNFDGVWDFCYDLRADIAGMPNCFACLSICYDDEELAFKCAVGIVYDDGRTSADTFGEHCSHLSCHMVTVDRGRVLEIALRPDVAFSSRNQNGLRALRGPDGDALEESDSEDELTSIHHGSLWLESELVEVFDDEHADSGDPGVQLCPVFVMLLRTLLNGDDCKCFLVWDAAAGT